MELCISYELRISCGTSVLLRGFCTCSPMWASSVCLRLQDPTGHWKQNYRVLIHRTGKIFTDLSEVRILPSRVLRFHVALADHTLKHILQRHMCIYEGFLLSDSIKIFLTVILDDRELTCPTPWIVSCDSRFYLKIEFYCFLLSFAVALLAKSGFI